MTIQGESENNVVEVADDDQPEFMSSTPQTRKGPASSFDMHMDETETFARMRTKRSPDTSHIVSTAEEDNSGVASVGKLHTDNLHPSKRENAQHFRDDVAPIDISASISQIFLNNTVVEKIVETSRVGRLTGNTRDQPVDTEEIQEDGSSTYCYESDYEYEEEGEEDDVLGESCSDQENRKMESCKKPKTIENDSRDISILSFNALPAPSDVPKVASLPSVQFARNGSNALDSVIDSSNGFCCSCQNQEDHTPVADCSLVQDWNRLVREYGNGILDVPGCLMEFAMRHRVEECYTYVHTVLRGADGWAEPTEDANVAIVNGDIRERQLEEFSSAAASPPGRRGSHPIGTRGIRRHLRRHTGQLEVEALRTERFFAHKTRDAVASDLRAHGWNVQAWRNAMRRRQVLERELIAASDPTATPWIVTANRRGEVNRLEREIANLDLDPLVVLSQENEVNASRVEAAAPNDRLAMYERSMQQVLRDHENFMQATLPGNNANPPVEQDSVRNDNRVATGWSGLLGRLSGESVATDSNHDLGGFALSTRLRRLEALDRQPVVGENTSVAAATGAARQTPVPLPGDNIDTGSAMNLEQTWSCPICLDDEVLPEDRICVRFPSPYRRNDEREYEFCGHFYCRDCWINYIQAWLEDVRGAGGGRLIGRLYCPHPHCRAQVNREHVERVLRIGMTENMTLTNMHPLLKLHDELALNSFVEGHRSTICWCPGPDCDRIMVHCGSDVFVPSPARHPVVQGHGYFTCCSSCDTKFCFHCGNAKKAHLHRDGVLVCPQVLPVDGDVSAVAGRGTRQASAITARLADRINPTTNLGRADSLTGINGIRTDCHHNKIRLCPNCNIPIEKNGGCAHMRCRCGHHFCWLCMADMTQNMGHFCGREGAGDIFLQNRRGRFGVEGDATVLFNLRRIDIDYLVDRLRDLFGICGNFGDDVVSLYQDLLTRQRDLYRFAHYYNRFVFHNQGQAFSSNQCECVANRATNYSHFSQISSAADTDFFQAANERLVLSRRILKYSYCLLYFKLKQAHRSEDHSDGETHQFNIVEDPGCPIDNAMSASLPVSLALFMDHQERLERVTEQLSFLSENATTPSDRSRVMDMIKIVDKCILAVKDLSVEQDFE